MLKGITPSDKPRNPPPSQITQAPKPNNRFNCSGGCPNAVRRRGAERIEFVLKPSLLLQALVPTPLQFAGDQPVIRVDSVILPSSVCGLETRLLERQFDLSALVDVFASARLKSRQRRFDAERLYALDDLAADRGVNAKTAKGDAALRPMVDGSAPASDPFFTVDRSPDPSCWPRPASPSDESALAP